MYRVTAELKHLPLTYGLCVCGAVWVSVCIRKYIHEIDEMKQSEK